MNWRFRCKVCGTIIEECMRIDEVYWHGELNVTHCDKQVEILAKGAPF